MARDSSGSKNQPLYDGTGAPATAPDQNEISNYAADVGNHKAGINADRLGLAGADLWNGLLFSETDTGDVYRRLGGAWILWHRPWTSYTPTLTNLTGTVTAAYKVVEGEATVRFRIVLTAAAGTNPKFTLPLNASDADVEFPPGQVMLADVSAGSYFVGVARRSAVGECELYVQVASGTYTQMTSITVSIPFGWASGDIITANVSYRPA